MGHNNKHDSCQGIWPGCRKKISTQLDDNISYDYPLNLSNDSLNSYKPHIAIDSGVGFM